MNFFLALRRPVIERNQQTWVRKLDLDLKTEFKLIVFLHYYLLNLNVVMNQLPT